MRTFTPADQRWFAERSGDSNPLHVDAEWAAARFPGQQVVHGVHALLWALDCHLAARPRGARSLHATFVKPIVVGDEVELESAPDGSVLRLTVKGEVMTIVRLRDEPVAPGAAPEPANAAQLLAAPRDRSGETLAGTSGTIAVSPRAVELARAFPAVSAAFGDSSAIGLAALSTLVGMECPGLYSLFSELSVTFTDADRIPLLAYNVTRRDAAFSRLDMAVSGLGLHGRVAAFQGRSGPSEPSDGEVRAIVAADAFAGARPLVIGGSSGLGRIAARLLLAGGASPVVTWQRAQASAERLAAQASAAGKRLDHFRFDAADPARGLEALERAGWDGDELYYFASPRIFRRRIEPYQRDDLREFLSIYVDGFYALVSGLMRMRSGRKLAVFYPSSTAISDAAADLFEYAVAKEAGERLCERLQRRHKLLRVVVERLPRIATRQTETFLPVRAHAALEVLLPIVRKVQGGAD